MSWSEFWESISVAQAVLWVLGVLAIITFVVKVWPKLRALVKLVDALAILPAFIERTDTKLAEIHHETHNNDGSSIKDSVDRIELGVRGLYNRTDALEAADTKLREDLENTRPPVRRRTIKPKETP